MQFQRKTSVGKSGSLTKILFRTFLVLLIFFIAVIFIGKIDFPSPNKKIEIVIPNENFKTVK